MCSSHEIDNLLPELVLAPTTTSAMSESPQHSDPKKDDYAQERKIGYVAENPVYNGDEGIGENKEFGEVKELR